MTIIPINQCSKYTLVKLVRHDDKVKMYLVEPEHCNTPKYYLITIDADAENLIRVVEPSRWKANALYRKLKKKWKETL